MSGLKLKCLLSQLILFFSYLLFLIYKCVCIDEWLNLVLWNKCPNVLIYFSFFFLPSFLYLWCRSTTVLRGHWDDDWVPAKQVLENLLGFCHTNHSHSMSTLYRWDKVLNEHSWRYLDIQWHCMRTVNSAITLDSTATDPLSLSSSLSSLFWHLVSTSGRWWLMRNTLIRPGQWYSAGLWSSVLLYGFPSCLLSRCTSHLDHLLR